MYIVIDYAVKQGINKCYHDIECIDSVKFYKGEFMHNISNIGCIKAVTLFNLDRNCYSTVDVYHLIHLFESKELIGVFTTIGCSNLNLCINIISVSTWRLSENLEFLDKKYNTACTRLNNIDRHALNVESVDDDGIYFEYYNEDYAQTTSSCLLVSYLDSLLCSKDYNKYIFIENNILYVPCRNCFVARYKILDSAKFSKSILMRRK